jgi:hypothetical protein
VDEVAEALRRGDSDALYALMSEESRRALSIEELRRVMAEQPKELGERGSALGGAQREIRTYAELRLSDGSIANLELTAEGYRVGVANALPAAARTPAQALAQLRRVLERRSYSGLMRVLSPATRSMLEGELRSLVEGLGAPDALSVDVVGDAAVVLVPGGHQVRLKREDGVWHVDDFD